MSKGKEVEVEDSREVEVDLIETMVELIFLYKKKEILNGIMKIKAKPSGKVTISNDWPHNLC